MVDPIGPEIIREHLARALQTLLAGEVQIVVIEGQDGIGKSKLLRQFSAMHNERTFSLFLSTASRWVYDPQQLEFDLYAQVHTYLTGEEPDPTLVVDEVDLRRGFNALRREAKRDGQPFYFVLDGLEDIPPADEGSRQQIIELLPFGMEGFRFLLSGDVNRLPLPGQALRFTKPYQLAPFSREEAATFLSGCHLTGEQTAEFYKVTGGVPGHLASIRRLLSSGRSPDELLRNLPEELPDLFRLEWQSVDEKDEAQILAIAILAHDTRAYTIQDISDITGVDAKVIEHKILSLTFLQQESDTSLRFASESYRRFAAGRLPRLRQRVNELIIEYFLRDPESEAALVNLPSYFTSANRLHELVQYLSPDRFARLYQRSPSLKLVQQQADQGIAAARTLNRTDDLVRFSLQRSAIEEIADSTIGVSEVRAVAAVGEYETALALAEAASRIEVRFRLLGAIARARKEQNLPEDPDLKSRIAALYEQLDPETLGRQLTDVASDLFAVWPDLAIELVSRAAGDHGENSIDWALARLAIQAHIADLASDSEKQAQKVHERIQDPAVKRLSMQAAAMLGGLNGKAVIAEADRLDSTGDRLFMLQHWMMSNRTHPDAVDVLDHALSLAIQSANYTANAQVYRQLAVCLPYVKDRQRSGYYLGLIDGQRSVLKNLGPTDEYIRLQLVLARAEWNHDQIATRNRFETIYNDIANINDIVVRTSAIASLAATIARVDQSQSLDPDLHILVNEELSDGIERVLTESAQHFEVARGVIRALSISKPEAALNLVARINVEYRRDLGYAAYVEAAATATADEVPISAVNVALDRIVDPRTFDDTIENLMDLLYLRALNESQVTVLLPLVERAIELNDTARRARLTATLLDALSPHGIRLEEMRRKLIQTIRSAWDSCDSSSTKLDIGYDIVATLALSQPEVAREYVNAVNELKQQLTLQDYETITAAALGVLLANRAYGGLLRHNLQSPDDIERLLGVIQRTGSALDQANLLADLAVRCYLAGRKKECERLVQQKLVPLILAIPGNDASFKSGVLVDVAPALYLGSPATATSLLKDIPDPQRDEALRRIIFVIFRKVAPSDPFEYRSRRGYDISFEEANHILALMREMSADWQVYGFIEGLVDSAIGSSRTKLNRGQKAEIVRQLDEIVSTKFPQSRNIQHQGYALAGRAQVNKMRDSLPPAFSIAALAAEARKIPNTSDRAYVLAIIGATVKQQKERRELLREAQQVVDSIPMLTDRLDRYELMSQLLSDIDKPLSKEILRKAVELSFKGEGASVEERRKSLLDAAYHLDPDFATSLASATDNDPAKKRMERHLEVYKISESVADKRSSLDETTSLSHDVVSRAMWVRLGSLNASRVSAIRPDRALPVLQYAAPQPVSRSYPIFAWFIENAARRTDNKREIRQYVLPLFEACLRGAELAILTSTRSAVLRHPVLSDESLERDRTMEASLVVDGDRQRGVQLLREWLIEDGCQKLYIVEPYFDPGSVELLALVRDVTEDCEVFIVASKKDSIRSQDVPYEDQYREAWMRIRSDEPPLTTVILAGTRISGKFPIHDRWWISEKGGVDLGTSYNGLGSRISKVRRLSLEEAASTLEELKPYFNQTRLEFEGERMGYISFTL